MDVLIFVIFYNSFIQLNTAIPLQTSAVEPQACCSIAHKEAQRVPPLSMLNIPLFLHDPGDKFPIEFHLKILSSLL